MHDGETGERVFLGLPPPMAEVKRALVRQDAVIGAYRYPCYRSKFFKHQIESCQ